MCSPSPFLWDKLFALLLLPLLLGLAGGSYYLFSDCDKLFCSVWVASSLSVRDMLALALCDKYMCNVVVG